MAFAADGRSALPLVPERRAELYVTTALSGGASWRSRPLGGRAGRQRDVRLPDAPNRPVRLRRGALAPAAVIFISTSPLNRTNSVPSRTSTTVPRHPSRGDGRVTRTREPMAIRPASVILSAVSGSLRTNFIATRRTFGLSGLQPRHEDCRRRRRRNVGHRHRDVRGPAARGTAANVWSHRL